MSPDSSDGARRTRSGVPLPVVVVTGTCNDGDNHGGAFARAVWNGVVQGADGIGESHAHLSEHDPITLDREHLTLIRGHEGVFEWKPRALLRSPIPVLLDDGGQAADRSFSENLRSLFRHCDVWEVIAAGDATNTAHVRTELESIDAPLLVLTDSTVHPEPSRLTELQCGPRNDRQAEALSWWVHKQQESRDSTVEARILRDYSAAGRYVDDLERELKREIHRQSHWTVETTSTIPSGSQPLIAVGYSNWALSNASALAAYKGPVVFSDGCWSTDVWHAATSLEAGRWYWSRPDVDFTELGRNVFVACCKAGRQLHTTHNADGRRQIRPFEFTALIEKYIPVAFRNPRYKTERILDAVPPPSTSKEKARDISS